MDSNGQNEDIDFVIDWVDGKDPKWQNKRSNFSVNNSQDSGDSRYRDWDLLKYLFRGIEKFAPWVHNIYFISDQQVPKWLNINHPKIILIDHKDYIPEKYLPTFNSNTIELNYHRIPGLSEKFVIFNDDCFLLKPVNPEDFFEKNLPKDIFMEYPIMCGGNAPVFSNILANDFNLIGKYYQRGEYKIRLLSKILSPKYGMYFFYNLLMCIIPYPHFFGLLSPHFARPYLKSSFFEIWDKETEALEETCFHRFRDPNDLNVYIMRIWNLMKGNFVPGNIHKMGKAYFINKEETKIFKDIEQQKYKLICLNDDCNDEIFNKVCPKIQMSFDRILPNKSQFERM